MDVPILRVTIFYANTLESDNIDRNLFPRRSKNGVLEEFLKNGRVGFCSRYNPGRRYCIVLTHMCCIYTLLTLGCINHIIMLCGLCMASRFVNVILQLITLFFMY